MEHDPDLYEAFPDDDRTAVMARGFLGGLYGACAFNVFFFMGILAGSRGDLGRQLAVSLAFVLLVFFLYFISGGVCFLVGLGASRLLGHRLDQRLAAVLNAFFTVYLPLGIPIWIGRFADSRSLFDTLVFGFAVSIPMSFVAVGAWIGADREFQSLQLKTDKSRQFDLKLLFSVTLLVSGAMFVINHLQLAVGFFVAFAVAIVVSSIVTTLVAWGRASWIKARSVSD